jgi:DnaJ family protein A protein 2
VHAIQVKLEDLYNGLTKKIRVTRTRICNGCNGVGAKNKDAVKECSTCHGKGQVMHMQQLAQGFMTQQVVTCKDCKGAGKTIDEKNKCSECKGRRVTNEAKTLEINIDKGMKHGQKLVFEGEADESPDVLPGDIVFVIQQKPHDLFERDNDNLYMKKKISLIEALTGVEFEVAHMDGRVLNVKNKAGKVIKPNQVLEISREGMPKQGNPFDKGSLLIQFEVEFPDTMPASSYDALQKILPSSKQKKDLTKDHMDLDTVVEQVMLVEPTEKEDRYHHQESYHEDDGEEGGGARCATQ